jgi:hypothetical protein
MYFSTRNGMDKVNKFQLKQPFAYQSASNFVATTDKGKYREKNKTENDKHIRDNQGCPLFQR